MKYNKNILILGGDSGLGKYLAKFFIKKKFNVFISHKTKTKKEKKNFFYLDYNRLKKFDLNLKKKINNAKLDYVLFLAAITTGSKQTNNVKGIFGNLELQEFVKFLNINCFAPIKIFEILKKKNFLKKNSKIIFFSSLAGSITKRGNLKHNKPFGNMIYRMSKSALNCGVKNLSYDFQKEHIIISLHPGFVKTKNGGVRI